MEPATVLLILALVFGFYMAWSIGANDVANAMGTSVGSGALTLKKAVIFAAILEFAGAFLVGSHVSDTVRKGIVNPEIFTGEPMLLVYGMIAALLAAGAWLQLASYYGWPVSTTHSIIGAVLGFGAVVGGLDAVNWGKVGSIVSSWIISPLLSGSVAFILFTILRKQIFYSRKPIEKAKQLTPILVFFVFCILTLVLVFKGLKNLNLDLPFMQAVGMAMLVGLIAAFISKLLVAKMDTTLPEGKRSEYQSPQAVISLEKTVKHLRKVQLSVNEDPGGRIEKMLSDAEQLRHSIKGKIKDESLVSEYKSVERLFVYLQILSACFVAFAHGANDVANAIGPLAAVISVLETGVVTMNSAVPLWVLALGGVGIVVGLATWGWRVIETIGKKITELTPTRGFCAEFAAAITIVFASKLGLPISTTHTLIGGVLGVGLARGLGALNLNTVRDIVISWIITIPAGAGMAIGIFYTLRAIFE